MKPKYTIIKTLFLFICFFNFLSANSKPAWVDDDDRLKNYPESEYLTGFTLESDISKGGNAELYNKLITNARTQLIQNVKVKIQVLSNLNTDNLQQNNSVSFRQQFTENASSTSDLELHGIKTETYYDKSEKTVYAFAWCRKSELRDYYKGRFTEKQRKIENSLVLAKNKWNNNRDIPSVADIDPVYPYLQEMELDINMISLLGSAVVADLLREESNSISQSIETLVNDMVNHSVSNVQLKANATEIQLDANKSASPLLLTATRDFVPARNLPLSVFQPNNERELDKLTTNETGVAIYTYKGIAPAQKAQIVSIKVDLAQLLNVDPNGLLNKKIISKIQTQSISIQVLSEGLTVMIETTGEPSLNEIVEPRLKQLLSNEGIKFTVDRQRADYCIQLNATVNDGVKKEYVVSVFVDVSYKITQPKTGLELHKNSWNNEKGFGKNKEQAIVDVLKRLNEPLTSEIYKKLF